MLQYHTIPKKKHFGFGVLILRTGLRASFKGVEQKIANDWPSHLLTFAPKRLH
jgi:hypothetical protein